MASEEGTSQGDPLAMAMYAQGILPLITGLQGCASQVWYADNATRAGSLELVKAWWDGIVENGPAYGYEANCSKMWLIVKIEFLEKAQSIFSRTGVQITLNSKRHLGAVPSNIIFVKEYLSLKVREWSDQNDYL